MSLYRNCFTPKNIALLHEAEDIDIKLKLYSYYLEEKTSYVKVKNLAHKLTEFFEKYANDFSITLPKVETTKKEEPSEFEITKTQIKDEASRQAEAVKKEPATDTDEEEE